jgi:hypothetical protein
MLEAVLTNIKEHTMHAIVISKEIYGVVKYYPMNDIALGLADIAGTKTITQDTINRAKKIGFTFEVQINRIEL